MKFSATPTLKKTDLIFLPLHKNTSPSTKIEKLLGQKISKSITAHIKNKDFEGEDGQTLTIFIDQGICKRLVLLGRGETKNRIPKHNEFLGGTISKIATLAKAQNISIITDGEDFEEIAYGIVLGSYEFTTYKQPDAATKKIDEVHFVTTHTKDHTDFLKKLSAFENASTFTRNLINTSANHQTPEDLANEAKKIAKKYGMKVKILNDKDLKKLGCGAIIGVGQGAKVGPQMAFIEYRNKTSKKTPALALIGKGITFDSGGMNLKPSGHIETMKSDMAGAATVLGAMQMIAELKLKGHFLGVIACAENALSDKSIHSGDVLTAYNKKNIEVINTDAEGRLVLADALAYTEKNYKPETIVDIATLTGAIIHAMGYNITGVIGEDEKTVEKILLSAKKGHERFWPLPLDEDFIKATKGDYTDLKNATDGIKAGPIMGAAFLKNFIEKTPWAHIDFAGTSWAEKPTSLTKYGATATGIRTLLELAISMQG